MAQGNYWTEPTETLRKEKPSLWMQQHLAIESTVFSIVAHSLDQRDVSGRMDEPTTCVEGHQEAGVVVGRKRQRVEGAK